MCGVCALVEDEQDQVVEDWSTIPALGSTCHIGSILIYIYPHRSLYIHTERDTYPYYGLLDHARFHLGPALHLLSLL